jgi:hypothetical protein
VRFEQHQLPTYIAAHIFSLEIVAKGSIVSHGVLIDYASWASLNSIPIHAFTSTPIPFAHIKQIIREQDITFRQDDILLIRAGYSRSVRYALRGRTKRHCQSALAKFHRPRGLTRSGRVVLGEQVRCRCVGYAEL